jgi:DNA-binding CsgD family transcriptional regulator
MLAPLARRLRQADSFVEVAHVVLSGVPEALGALGGVVEAHEPRGPALCVGSDWVGDEWARRYLEFGHRVDPCLAQVRTDHTPVATADLLGAHEVRELAAALACPEDLYRHGVVGPLLGDGELVGAIRLAWPRPVPPRVLLAAATLCAHVSVRLARIGFAPPAQAPALGRLSGRQLEVARLVARGYTNAEVALALAVTPDAVKKHVKHILANLDVANRTELAAMVGRAAVSLDPVADPAELPGVRVTRIAG